MATLDLFSPTLDALLCHLRSCAHFDGYGTRVSVSRKDVQRSRGHGALEWALLDLRTGIPKGFGLWYRQEVSSRANAGTEELDLAAADLQFRFVASIYPHS